MKTKIFFLVLSLVVIFTSCESNTYSELEPIVENPTYNANVKKVFTAKCVECHSASGNQYPPLENYNQVKDAIENGQVLCRIQDQCEEVMPKSGKMSQTIIDMIINWKNQGYVE